MTSDSNPEEEIKLTVSAFAEMVMDMVHNQYERLAKQGGAIAMEAFAKGIENAQINSTSTAARIGAQQAFAIVVNEANKMASAIRAEIPEE